jgi:hypothetical protein
MARPSSLVWLLTPVSSRAAPVAVGVAVTGVGANVRSAPSCIAGCGKSTFMRRMTSIFGGSPKPPAGVQLQATPAAQLAGSRQHSGITWSHAQAAGSTLA